MNLFGSEGKRESFDVQGFPYRTPNEENLEIVQRMNRGLKAWCLFGEDQSTMGA